MAYKEVFPEKFSSLWNCNYVGRRSFTPPPGKAIVWTPVQYASPQSILNAGVTHISFNPGIGTGDIPEGKTALFYGNPDIIKTFAMESLGGKIFSQFTEQDCKNAAAYMVAQNGGRVNVITTGTGEFNSSNKPWTQTTIPIQTDGYLIPAAAQQYEWYDREVARLMGLYGGRYGGNYDGHDSSMSVTGDGGTRAGAENLRDAYNNDSAAYNVLHATSPFGNPYFTGDHYTFRDGIIKTYWDGSTDPAKRIFQITTGLVLSRRALTYRNNMSSRLISFPFPGYQEFINRLEEYKRNVPAGGTVTSLGFPQYSTRAQSVIGYLSLALAEMIFMWEDTIMSGTDPNIISNQGNDSQFNYSGGGATRLPVRIRYDAAQPAPFPRQIVSGHNAMLSGIEFYSRAAAWAGQTLTYAPYRTPGGSFSATGKDYLLNSYQQYKPMGFLHKQGNRYALWCVQMNTAPGTYQQYEFNTGNEIVSVNMEGQRPYLFLGEA